MSTEVNKAFVNKYRSNFIHLAQQKGARLRNFVRVNEGVVGKADHFDRLGSTAAQKMTSRHADTPLISTPHSRRKVVMEDYNWADLVDKADKIKMLSDPGSEYMTAGVWAMGRTIDDLILAAMTGNATSVSSTDATSSVALPSAQKIAHGSAGMTMAKLREARKILRAADIDQDEDLYLAISADKIDDLFAESGTPIISVDYNEKKPLVEGSISYFMGFNLIHTERLGNDSNDNQQVMAWAKSGVGLSIGQNIETKISERPDKNYSMQVYAQMSLGATRIQDNHVVEIACQ
tara:strand:+ start:2082 stop:2954 length:873 start_codon:yes stop_codon:yes gene_type:complete